MSKLFLDILDADRVTIFSKLNKFSDIGILGGGTALALQIGHRISYDFDIFIDRNIDMRIWRKSKEILGRDSIKILENEDQLDLITPNGVKVTFFKDDYLSQYEPVTSSSIKLMNIKDIAANKALIQGRRPKWRDYVDLYFLLKGEYIGFEELIALSIKKFKTDFSEKLFLEQLVYWDDVRSYDIEYIKNDITKETIKEFFVETVKKYKQKII